MSEQACEKCGSVDIYTCYHAKGCNREKCSCTRCGYNDHNKRRDEHLHRHCHGCSWDWCDDVGGSGE